MKRAAVIALFLLIVPAVAAPQGKQDLGRLTSQSAKPTKMAAEFGGTMVWGADSRSNIDNLAPATVPVQIAVQRWTSESERAALVAALKTDRAGALRTAMDAVKPPVGYLSFHLPVFATTTEGTRDSLRYAVERRGADGVRRITLVSASESIDWIELVVHPDGSAEGFLERDGRVGVNTSGDDIELKSPGRRRALIKIRTN